ncbi:uncharacterized protein CTRU02_214975 [Colletotrichum truncatum]|uniref:Uncharacterized protein n=1 Tax=Colletotrichum truncatum TaxID=5467 RepID=A0ACC3YE88_COLTU|nr:uncharacterized protein CTRU02_08273 [Colletotrichum truncatum]KAF6790144.1 hypothetical protein CTRU02_08273 [Colletotrichum truncatum]
MADPLSVASGILAIVTATLQSSKFLYNTVQSFQNHRRVVQQLFDELTALNNVLQSLETLVRNGTDDATLLSLKVPLLQCRRACADFDALIIRCSKNSGRDRTSFRDWVKIRYMEGDITGFTSMLAGYKSTISIALGNANLRSATVSLKILNEYKDTISSTTQELEDHLEDINSKLEHLIVHQKESSQSISNTIERIQEEKDSTEACLQICAQVQARIDEMHFRPASGTLALNETSCQSLTRPMVMTMSTLSQCKSLITDNITQLRKHQEEADKERLRAGAIGTPESLEIEIERLQGGLESTKKRLTICSQASENATKGVHVLEDMVTGHDGQQVFVSTLGDLFDVKGASTGDRGIQFVGSVSEPVLYEFFRSQRK